MRTIFILCCVMIIKSTSAQTKSAIAKQIDSVSVASAPLDGLSIPPLDSLYRWALENSPIVKQQDALLEKTAADTKRVRKSWMDGIKVNANIRSGSYGNSVINQTETGYSFGPSISFSLYDFASNKNLVDVYKAENKVTYFKKEEVKFEIQKIITFLYNNIQLQELIGNKAIDLLLDPESKDILAKKQHEREHGKSNMYSIPIKNKNGENRWWLISGTPQYNDNGEIVGSIGVHLDVTDQKKIEEELLQAKIKAEESSKAKEFFLANMSHEIRTPLNAIVGLSDLMQIDKNSISEDNIKILNFSSKNLHALITGILDLTKIDAGKNELVKNNFNLHALLESVWLSFKTMCDDKNIDLRLEISDKIPIMLIGDELRLYQILNNLISNAIKFTSKGFVTILVESLMQEKNTARILFTISDSGFGIRKKNLKTIFRAFEQADRNIVRQFGGTGLGLSITQKLIHLHGSEIHVSSKLNKGSVFTFHIDYQIYMQNVDIGKVKQTANFLHGKSLKGKKILLVEDNQVNQLIAVSYLNHWNIITDIANNGKEAIEKLEMNSYDLVLLDIFMPVMDGFETTKQIRHNPSWKTLPIIALTASAETNLIDKIIRLGANLCLTKPVDSKELFQALCSFFVQEQMKELPSTNSKKITKSKDKMPSLSLQKIEDASLGSSKFLEEMIALLLLEIPQTIQEAEDQLRHKNFLSFSATIHKLKNNLLMLSMDYLREDLNFLEEHAKVTNVSTKLRPVFKRLKECWEVSASELKSMQTL